MKKLQQQLELGTTIGNPIGYIRSIIDSKGYETVTLYEEIKPMIDALLAFVVVERGITKICDHWRQPAMYRLYPLAALHLYFEYSRLNDEGDKILTCDERMNYESSNWGVISECKEYWYDLKKRNVSLSEYFEPLDRKFEGKEV